MLRIPRPRLRRAAIVVASLIAATAVASSGGVAASAAPDDFGNVDPAAPASITVHKHEYQEDSPAVEGAPDGTAGVPSAPIAGVEFTAYPIVGLDLADAASWDALATLRPGAGACAAPSGYSLGDGVVAPPTDADGVTRIPVPVGAYLVCETDAPASVVERAQAFIVTVPLPFQNGWLYDVHVYPKNGTASVSKTIAPQEDLGLGGVIRFPVTTDVPVLGEERLTSYVVSDRLDVRLAADVDADAGVGVASVRLAGGGAVDPSFYTVSIHGQTVRVSFTAAGLTWLESQDGRRLETTFQAVLTEVGDGRVANEAVLYVNDPDLRRPTGVSPTVTSNWGGVRILKTDDASPATPLAGAVFEVYAATDPYAADCAASSATGSALVVRGASRFTSAADGVVAVAGLYVSDSVNAPISASQRCYVVREVQAPAGFITPIGAAADTAVTVTIGETAQAGFQAEIRNAQQTVPVLPLTGANGQVAMTVAGIALMGVAVGVVLVRRRRTR